MSLTKLFTNYAVKLHAATAQAGGAAYVDGVQSIALSSGLSTFVEGGDGAVYNTFGGLRSGAPSARVTSNDIKAVLDAIVDYMTVDSDVTHPGVELYAQRYAAGGTRSSSSDALKTTIAAGLAVLRTIELGHQAVGTITFEVIPYDAAGGAPVAFDEAAALPAASAQVAAVWTVGKVDLNGTQLQGVESVSIDFGVDVLSESRDSDIFPSVVAVRRIQPSVTIRAAHIDVTSLATESGVYIASGVVLYARKRALGGTFVADGTAEHISFTLGKCRVDWRSIDGDPKQIELVITPWNTQGGSAPITVDTTAAIA